MSDLIAIKFKVEGFEVDQAFSLSEAKQKLSATTPYNAILSDYLLPDGNALDLFTEVRSLPQVAKVPIILATNYIEDLSQDKAKSLGINEIIVKYQIVPAQMVEKVKLMIQTPSPAAPSMGPAPIGSGPAPSPAVSSPALGPQSAPAAPVAPTPPPAPPDPAKS